MVQQMKKPTAVTPLVIGVIVFEKVMLMDYVGTTSYLELLTDVCGVPIEIHTISQKQGPLRAVNGVPLYATVGYEDAPTKLDILLIPGSTPAGTLELKRDQEFLKYIRNVAQQSTYVLTVCTGAAILAQTGFLDGKRATTNKLDFNNIVDAHPSVNWVPKARWVVDGNIWSGSGVSAGMDMGYAFIASLHGSEAADMMAKIIEVVPSKDPANDPFAVVYEHASE